MYHNAIGNKIYECLPIDFTFSWEVRFQSCSKSAVKIMFLSIKNKFIPIFSSSKRNHSQGHKMQKNLIKHLVTEKDFQVSLTNCNCCYSQRKQNTSFFFQILYFHKNVYEIDSFNGMILLFICDFYTLFQAINHAHKAQITPLFSLL